jgi:dTDP-glucose 4,6-dehydratase
MKILVTGGNGFIGHHFIEHLLKSTDFEIDIIDRLSYASMGYSRLKDVDCYDQKRIRHFTHDFTKSIQENLLLELQNCEYIVHMGAETHVDRSIENPRPFVMSNVVGTFEILEFARKCSNLKKMIYFSTDEVFGPAIKSEVPKGFKEWDRYKSSNPYAATKAGGEELCIAYHNTYKLPIVVTHTMNVFGERQHPEKFIPKVINAVTAGTEVIIHCNSERTIPGSRFWIHARNVADAITYLLEFGSPGEKYNIVGEKEIDNLTMANIIADILQMTLKFKMVDFHSSRPGHDLRYALDGSKLAEMGYVFPKTFENSLIKTIEWFMENPIWLL